MEREHRGGSHCLCIRIDPERTARTAMEFFMRFFHLRNANHSQIEFQIFRNAERFSELNVNR